MMMDWINKLQEPETLSYLGSFLLTQANILLIAVSLFFIVLYMFPLFENQLTQKINIYFDQCKIIAEKMFFQVSSSQLFKLMLSLSCVLFPLALYVTWGFYAVSFIFCLALVFIIWQAPRAILNFMWNRRLQQFDVQLIDGLNLMSNSLKSGLNLQQSLQVLVKEMPKPLSEEFALVLSQKKLGLNLDQALEKMLDRLPSEDLSVAIHSILILRETGGDLSETFDIIAHTIRERRKVDGKIQGLTAQGKMQGIILFSMPFAFGIFLYISNPQYIEPLFTTMLGWMFILFAIVLQCIGYIWIKKIINIEV